MLFNDVQLRARRALSPLTLSSNCALLVLNRTSLTSINALLALKTIFQCIAFVPLHMYMIKIKPIVIYFGKKIPSIARIIGLFIKGLSELDIHTTRTTILVNCTLCQTYRNKFPEKRFYWCYRQRGYVTMLLSFSNEVCMAVYFQAVRFSVALDTTVEPRYKEVRYNKTLL